MEADGGRRRGGSKDTMISAPATSLRRATTRSEAAPSAYAGASLPLRLLGDAPCDFAGGTMPGRPIE